MDSICQYLGNNKCHRTASQECMRIRSWVAGKSSAAAPGSSESSERVSDLPAGRYVIPKMERSTRQIFFAGKHAAPRKLRRVPTLGNFCRSFEYIHNQS